MAEETKVKVTPAKQAINENGAHYAPGDVLEVSRARAKALGPLVKPAPKDAEVKG